MIEFEAPGKAVIWGEYAVLEGAPALVMALNRYARTRITPGGDRWHIRASGLTGSQKITARALRENPIEPDNVAAVVAAGLAALGDEAWDDLPPGAEVLTDTSHFYQGTTKLGIGSSAAVCTATYAALASLLDVPFTYRGALAAHHALQGSAGSGLDVAAAYHGGLIRFERREVSNFPWPDGLHYQFIWTGHAARTTDHLARYNTWKARSDTSVLTELCRASERLFKKPELAAFANYTTCLKNLDDSAEIGIYDPTHRELEKLAKQAQVVYKPCGAGGGDIGIAVSDDAASLNHLVAAAAKRKFQILTLEIAGNGIHRIRD
ncbi:MAG: mevalonate kinase [Pseudomonadales bacterium]